MSAHLKIYISNLTGRRSSHVHVSLCSLSTDPHDVCVLESSEQRADQLGRESHSSHYMEISCADR